jgi:hypothetical protein
MTTKIISPKSTPQYPNLIFTPDLTLATVNDVTILEDTNSVNTPTNYDEYLLLDEIIIIGNDYPVIFTASDIFDQSWTLNSNEQVAIGYLLKLYDNTAPGLVISYSINYFYLISYSGIPITYRADMPSFRIIQILTNNHEYSWSISFQKFRTGTSTISGTSSNRILIAQEVKR